MRDEERDLRTMDVLIAWMEELPGRRALQVVHRGETLTFMSRAEILDWANELCAIDPGGTVEIEVHQLVKGSLALGPIDPDTGRWRGVPEPDVILEIEAAGQQAFVESDTLPIRIVNGSDADLEALGIVLGEPVDDHFRRAVLPEGWTRKPAPDHSMWNYIDDEKGQQRLAIFFKAAPYDYRAEMRIEKP